MTQKLLLATHNKSKIKEISAILEPLGFEIITSADLGLPEPEETGRTLLENARLKAHDAARRAGVPAIADDSGLEIDNLRGEPGVYTADWSKAKDGSRDPMLSMQRIHDAAFAVGAPLPSAGRYRCTIVLAQPDGSDTVFNGCCEGGIVWPPRGENGFGEDPIFVPEGYRQTFGELPASEKLAISHRTKAVKAMAEAFKSNEDMTRFPWARLTPRSKDILEWLEGPYTGKENTLTISANEKMLINGQPSSMDCHRINYEDMSEIFYFLTMDDEVKVRAEGQSLLLSLSKGFDGKPLSQMSLEDQNDIFESLMTGRQKVPGQDSWQGEWDDIVSSNQNAQSFTP